MATFTPISLVTPLDLTAETLAIGDKEAFLTKQNSLQNKLATWTSALSTSIASMNTLGDELESAFTDFGVTTGGAVTLSTDQSITGLKTFTQAITGVDGADDAMLSTKGYVDTTISDAVIGAGGGVTDHGLLTGRGDDDHAQYHTDARGDALYYRKSAADAAFATAAQGALADSALQDIASAALSELSNVATTAPADGQVLTFDTTNGWQPETSASGVTDHGLLDGLADDDHAQYHTDARGDARYYAQAAADALLDAKQDVITPETAFNKAFGTTSGTVTQGDDARLADARTPLAHNQAASTITTGTFDDARIAASNVTQHEAALSIAKSQITSFSEGDYATAAQGSTADTALQNIVGESIKSLSDVYGAMVPTDGQALIFDTTNGWQAESLGGGGDMLASNNLSEVTAATARVNLGLEIGVDVQAAGSYATAAQGTNADTALQSITGEVLSDLSNVATTAPADGQVLTFDTTNGWQPETPTGGAEVNDLSASVTWATVPDANISEGSVTQHEAALSITKGQITAFSDADYATAAQGVKADGAAQKSANLSDVTAATARTNLDVDQAGTDNSTDVTLAGTPDYLTLAGQVLTRGPIVLTTDVAGVLPMANIASGTPNGTQYVRDDGTLAVPPAAGSPEGTDVVSTGETGGAKYLREDGDGTCSWQTPAGSGDMLASNNLSEVTAVTARTNLGLAIGADVQAYNAALSGTTGTYTTADSATLGTALQPADIGSTVQAYDASIVVDADIGTSVQAYNAALTGTTGTYTTANATTLGTALQSVASVAGIDDVTISAIAADELLQWNGSAWINKTLGEAGIEPADGTILKDADIGATVQAYNAALSSTTGTYTTANSTTLGTALQPDDIGVSVQGYDATMLVDADIGVSVQAYNAALSGTTGTYTTANSATLGAALQPADIGATVQGYDATLLVDADIGVNVQAYNAALSGTTGTYTAANATTLSTALQDITSQVLSGLSNVAATAPSDGQVLTFDTTNGWQPETPSASGEVNDLSTSVTWVNVPNANITEGSVTQHAAALVTTGAVTSAGAVMDSEVDANIKTLALPASTTISAFGATLVDDASNTAARSTLGLGALATLGTVGTAQITNSAVTYAKLQNVSANTLLGNNTGGATVATALSASQVRALLALVVGTNVQAYNAALTSTTATYTTAKDTKVNAIPATAAIATKSFWQGTQTAYNGLTKDANTLYFIEA